MRRETIQHVAKVACIGLQKEEELAYMEECEEVLKMFDMLAKADDKDVAPTFTPAQSTTELRDDTITVSDAHALSCAQHIQEKFIIGPRTLP